MADTRELLIRISADAKDALKKLDGIDAGVVNVGKSADKVKDTVEGFIGSLPMFVL